MPTRPSRLSRRARILSTLALALALPLFGLLPHAQAANMPMFKVGDEVYVTLPDIASFYGMRLERGPERTAMLVAPAGRLEFEGGSRRAIFFGIDVWLHVPVQRVNSKWAITQTDMKTLVDPLLRSHVHLGQRQTGTVVLDPGHGGRDPGSVSPRGIYEKDLALDIAQRARSLLANQGIRVLMTREADRYVSLPLRPRFAAERGADLFVSIHVNAAPNRSAQGVETYVLTAPGYASSQSAPERQARSTQHTGNGSDGANTYLAYMLHRSMLKRTASVDRGIRNARFLVLRDASCPAALVECGFLTNIREESSLRSPHYRNSLAQGIAQGVLDYYDAAKRARIVQSRAPTSVIDQLLSGTR